jgi:hypothetical protein
MIDPDAMPDDLRLVETDTTEEAARLLGIAEKRATDQTD